MTERERYAIYCAVRFWFGSARRIAPSWWSVRDQVWANLKDYDAHLRRSRAGRKWT